MPNDQAKIEAELKKLAGEIYSEGYMCGVTGAAEDKYFTACAKAMLKIASGDKYRENMTDWDTTGQIHAR